MQVESSNRRASQRLSISVFVGISAVLIASSATAESSPAAAGSPPTALVTNPQTPQTTREAMREIFAQLQILLPAAIQGELGAAGRKEEIAAAFERMQRRVDALPEHGEGLDPGARLFGQALSRDIRRAHDFFDSGRFENAAFIVESLVDDCTACHIRRKADDSLITQGFVRQAALKDLDPLQRAAIAVATRRFDEAMGLYERAFREPGIVPEVLLGPIVRYLTVTTRVARDPERARKQVARFIELPELSANVHKDVEHWKKALDGLSASDFAGTNLARARVAMESADRIARYPGDQRALIEFLLVSSQLHDLVSLPQESPAAAAEIYELLGRAELGVSQSLWHSRADLYWETAIRLAPGSQAAKRAYARLEEETHAGYTGSGGLRLPFDEVARLEELKALVEGKRAGPAEGAELFAVHCALCHGRNGEGRGALSAQLMWNPADLTRIATRRDGVFPEFEVFELIARRDPLGNHQSPEMPRWGKFWKDDSKIDALVAYLRTIQQP
jgi:mono/diheme cytochrome c family protein